MLDLLQTGGGVHRELAAVIPAPGVLAALYDVLPRRSSRLVGTLENDHALVRGYRAVATDPAAARRARRVSGRDLDLRTAGSSALLDELSGPPRAPTRDTDRQDAVADPDELVPW